MQLGKYSSDRDSALHFLCVGEWSNESFGNVEAPTGYVWRISNTWEDVKPINMEFNSVIEDWVALDSDIDGVATEFRKSLVGHFLVVEDEQGFVSVHEYATETLLLQAFKSLEEIYAAWDEQGDD